MCIVQIRTQVILCHTRLLKGLMPKNVYSPSTGIKKIRGKIKTDVSLVKYTKFEEAILIAVVQLVEPSKML